MSTLRRNNARAPGPGEGSPGLTVKVRMDFLGGTTVVSLGQEDVAQKQVSRCEEIRTEQQGRTGEVHSLGDRKHLNTRSNGLCQLVDGAAVGPPSPL